MNDDIISRKMAIDAIIDHIREKFAQRDTPLNYISGLYKAEDIIEYLPSAERKKGKWTAGVIDGYYVCSNCKRATKIPWYIGAVLYDYCPNCGAVMERSDE